MTTVILLRHGRSTANNNAVLAGRTPGVDLDETGRRQAAGLVTRLADVPIARVVCSPLLRCQRTVAPLAEARGLTVETDEQLAEVDYGEWTGRPLSELATETLWRTVQIHPSAAQFPGGEALAAVSARATQAARHYANLGDANAQDMKEQDALASDSTNRGGKRGNIDTAKTTNEDDEGAVLLCSHGDVIKAILADALGMHLDLFQRLMVSPASVSVVRYTALGVMIGRINDTGTLAGVGNPPHAQPQNEVPRSAHHTSDSSRASLATDSATDSATDPAGTAAEGMIGGDTGRSDA